MPKINRNLSVYISIVLTALMLAAVVALAFYLPAFIDRILNLPGNGGAIPDLTPFQRTFVYVAFYAELAFMLLGLGLLFALLILVQRKRVFTDPAVELIRYISWCLIFMGAVMTSLTFFRTNALIVGIALFFVGLTIRVVKNVIESAVFIKKENDLTV